MARYPGDDHRAGAVRHSDDGSCARFVPGTYDTPPTSSNAGLFRDGTRTGNVGYADFAQSLTPYNSNAQGSSGGTYTVRAGDTLSSIAQMLYGDANLWYKIAEANGLSSQSGLTEGQALTLPAGVTKNTHSADTFKPYDPMDAIGDLSPTTPKPPKKPKCAVFKLILMAVLAAAATIVTAGAALAVAAPATAGITSLSLGIGTVLGGGMIGAVGLGGAVAIGAGAAAVGSIMSQALGVATGMQEKLNWKGVGLSALSGGITAGLGSSFGGDWAAAAGRGALASAMTQGIGVATRLQSKFDFAGVAAAGVSAGVGHVVGGPLGGSLPGRIASGTVAGIANAATRSAINGSNFGDNFRVAMPDIIGNAIGNLLADTVTGAIADRKLAKQEAKTDAQVSKVFQDSDLSQAQREDPRYSEFVRMELAAGKSVDQITLGLSDPAQTAHIAQMDYVKIPGTEAYALAIPAGHNAEFAEIPATAESYGVTGGKQTYRPKVTTADFESLNGSVYSKMTVDQLNGAIAKGDGGKDYYYGGYYIQGGTQGQRIDIAQDLVRIAGTTRGKLFIAKSLQTKAQERIIVDPGFNDYARAYTDYGAIRINPINSAALALPTAQGWQRGPGQVVAVLAHEMGHIYSRIGDNNMGKDWHKNPAHWQMENVTLNENPIRRELGLPARTSYDYYKFDRIGLPPGLYRQSYDPSTRSWNYNVRVGPTPNVTEIKRPK